MRRLIWLVLYGEEQTGIAEACIESIRVAGEFDGEIRLFTDHPVKADAVQVIVPPLREWCAVTSARIDHGLAIDLDAFDAAMYMDVDHLCLGPIDSLFERLCALRGMQEPRTVMGTHRGSNGFLTPSERRQAVRPSICSGLVAGPPSILRRTLEAWKGLLHTSNSSDHFRDQYALNALVFRNVVPFTYYTPSQLSPIEGVHSRLRDGVTVLHYWNVYKRWMCEDWDRWKRYPLVSNPEQNVSNLSNLVS